MTFFSFMDLLGINLIFTSFWKGVWNFFGYFTCPISHAISKEAFKSSKIFKKNYHKTRILAATSHITFSCLHSPSGVRFLRPVPQAQKNSSKKLLKKNRKNAKMSLLDGSGMAWRAGGYPSIFFHHFFLSLPIVFTINLPLRPDCLKMNIRPTPHSFFPLKRLSIHYYMVYAKCATLGLVNIEIKHIFGFFRPFFG